MNYRYVEGINIHEVKRVELSGIHEYSEMYTREITVITKYGNRIEITLFAKDKNALLVNGVGTK